MKRNLSRIEVTRPLRAMWLLNHTTARKFEISMLKRLGIQEIFLPKKIPSEPTFRSGSVDWTEDVNLTIPSEDLAILNAADWYGDPGVDAWHVANKHFQLAFFIVLKAAFFRSISRHFLGAKIWRAYGLSDPPLRYSRVLTLLSRREGPSWSPRAADSLWFGQAYGHLAEIEPPWLADRAVYLPAGMAETDIDDKWAGTDRRILFVCPDLAFNDYYQAVYREFKKTFAGLPYAVAGAQPVKINDSNVLGYVSNEQHRQNMRSFMVIYYHSTEPNHVHYHPFEAIRAGIPLIFMAGGLLDRIGGLELPGRCKSPQEARSKVERILANDKTLIDAIRRAQPVLLEAMKAANCEPAWRQGLEKILKTRGQSSAGKVRRKLAVILPVSYRGGTLRGAQLLTQAIARGSQKAGSPVDIVFGHPEDPAAYSNEEFADLPPNVEKRPYRWTTLTRDAAVRACSYAGVEDQLESAIYMVPDDGINQFVDCDLWIFVSDRLSHPVLPVRPHLLAVYDYIQRYLPIMDEATNLSFLDRAHEAEAVLVTTEFTAADVRQFAGVQASKVKKVPLLAPFFSQVQGLPARATKPSPHYFVWTTNLALHKNHENAFKALRLYYEDYDGQLECHITGVGTKEIFKLEAEHLRACVDIRESSKLVKSKVTVCGELLDRAYRRKLQDAAFLWHAGKIDNGTFSVVEAASLSIPSLSSNYPAMREICDQFKLPLTWADPDDPADMAKKLKQMEEEHGALSQDLLTSEALAQNSVDQHALEYWNVIKEYL